MKEKEPMLINKEIQSILTNLNEHKERIDTLDKNLNDKKVSFGVIKYSY